MESLGEYLRELARQTATKSRVKRPYPGIFQAIVLILLLWVVDLLVTGIAGGFSPNAQLDSPRFVICDVVSFAIILALGLRRTRASFSEVFPLTGVGLSLYFPIVLSLIGMNAITFNVNSYIYAVYPPPAFVRHVVPDLIHAGGYWNAFFQLVVIAPVVEEFLFRGLILRGLLKRYGTITAVTLSAALFGASHFDVWQASSAFIGGLLLGWWAVETGSLVPCLFGHAFWNFFVFSLFMIPRWWPSANLSVVLKSVRFVPLWFVLTGACVFGVGLFMLRRSFRTNRDFAEIEAVGL